MCCFVGSVCLSAGVLLLAWVLGCLYFFLAMFSDSLITVSLKALAKIEALFVLSEIMGAAAYNEKVEKQLCQLGSHLVELVARWFCAVEGSKEQGGRLSLSCVPFSFFLFLPFFETLETW